MKGLYIGYNLMVLNLNLIYNSKHLPKSYLKQFSVLVTKTCSEDFNQANARFRSNQYRFEFLVQLLFSPDF